MRRRQEVDDDFAAYVTARWPRFVGAMVMLGCSAPDAEDIVQATLVKCYRSIERVRDAQDRDAYVHRALINTLRSAQRRRWHGELPTADLPEGLVDGDPNDAVETREVLHNALLRLPPAQRAVVVLRFYSHLDQQQTALALQIPTGTVKSRLSRALVTLAADPSLSDLRGTR